MVGEDWRSRIDASLVTLRCLLSVALSARWRFSHLINTGDGRYSLPHPLIRFFQTSPTYWFSEPNRIQRAAPSVPLNGQSTSLVTLDTRPILQRKTLTHLFEGPSLLQKIPFRLYLFILLCLPSLAMSFLVKHLVRVAVRTTPGINLPGGVGKITNANPDGSYNIRYVLGGSERNVHPDAMSAYEQEEKRPRRGRATPAIAKVAKVVKVVAKKEKKVPSKKAPVKKAPAKKAPAKKEKTAAPLATLPRTRETALRAQNYQFIVGVDEAGRGPLCGPVVIGAVLYPASIACVPGIVDSKQISDEEERERLYEALVNTAGVRWAAAVVDNKRVDEINILQATCEGMRMAANAVLMPDEESDKDARSPADAKREGTYVVVGGAQLMDGGKGDECYALIDGNRFPNWRDDDMAKRPAIRANGLRDIVCEGEPMVKGDGREYVIGAASIIAKVRRNAEARGRRGSHCSRVHSARLCSARKAPYESLATRSEPLAYCTSEPKGAVRVARGAFRAYFNSPAQSLTLSQTPPCSRRLLSPGPSRSHAPSLLVNPLLR